MLCENCGKNEATIKFTQIINGNKIEMMICEECGEKMGITQMNFEMPIDISNFIGEFITDQQDDHFLPFNTINTDLRCKKCNMTYAEFLNNGKFGCEECYKAFGDKIDILLKRIQASDKYLGRKAKYNAENKVEEVKPNNRQEELQKQLKDAIKEERYEDAAKIRDEIRKEGLQ